MALISCPQCGRQISDKAKKCPGCGWIPGIKVEEKVTKVPVQEEKTVKNDTRDLVLENLKQEKGKLEKEIQKLQSQNTQLNTCMKNGEKRMQEIIAELQEKNKQVTFTKDQLAQKVYQLQNQAPKFVDNTDYKTIDQQKEIIAGLQKQINDLEKSLSEAASKESESIDKTDYAMIDSLKNELEALKTEKLELEKKLQNKNKAEGFVTSQDLENNTDRLLKKIIIIMAAVVASLTLIGIAIARLNTPTKMTASVGTTDTAVSEASDNKENEVSAEESTTEENSIENNTDVSEETEDVTDNESADSVERVENKSYEGELIGQIINGTDELDGITCSYMGVSSNTGSYIDLDFRITNNSGKDIVFDYKKNYYMNNNVVYVAASNLHEEIQNGRSSTLDIMFEKRDVEMTVGDVINDFEIECENPDTDEKFSILFNGINIDVNEETE